MQLTTNSLSGAWALHSFVLDNGPGPPRAWAEKVSGLLVYHPDGFMAVSVDGWAERSAGDQICSNKFSYMGRFEVDGANKIVIHIVRHASDPLRVGQRLRRRVTFQDTMLTLTCDTATKWRRLAGSA